MTIQATTPPHAEPLSLGAAFNLFVIGLMAFLTVVDLFATQAILPVLARHYGVSASAMGVAVNASTLGMAASGIGVALFSQYINRRIGIVLSLLVLAIPTALLAYAPDLTTFTVLRVCQGLLMSAAFTLTLAHLGERCTVSASASAFAAYVTGNVASNLVGRLIAATTVAHLGVESNFYLFAALNVAGAALAYVTVSRAPPMPGMGGMVMSPFTAVRTHISNPALRTAFLIGFCILFAFIGTFTYVNFVLTRPPLALGMTTVAFVYFVFAPSIVTTPLAGGIVARYGARTAMWGGLGLALAGLPLLLMPNFVAVLAGMVLVACGTFFAQATATGFVSRAAAVDRGAASGLYLASYFLGGLAGSAVLGALFDRLGWAACVAGIGAALVAGMLLTVRLTLPQPAATR